jgi:hypothetical protein
MKVPDRSPETITRPMIARMMADTQPILSVGHVSQTTDRKGRRPSQNMIPGQRHLKMIFLPSIKSLVRCGGHSCWKQRPPILVG